MVRMAGFDVAPASMSGAAPGPGALVVPVVGPVVPAVVAAVLLFVAVLLWPNRSSARRRVARMLLDPGARGSDGGKGRGKGRGKRRTDGAGPVTGRSEGAPVGGGWPSDLAFAARTLWRADPVAVLRRWRARRRPETLLAAALSVLEGIEPAIRAGLTPAEAVRISAGAVGPRPGGAVASGAQTAGTEPRPLRVRARPDEVSRLATALLEGVSRGVPLSDVWQRLAVRTGSTDLAFVASAWHLSESTGAPLAVAVERAAEGLRDGRSRRRRVAVAVAGPRATVTVLTLLPLTGPLFGLACGVGPGELYLSTPLATVSVLAGVVLIVAGRFWCTRLVRRAVSP